MNVRLLKQLLKTFYPAPLIILAIIFKYLSITQVIIGLLLICIYQRLTIKTQLIYQSNKFNNDLLENCPLIKNANFKPPFLFFHHLSQLFLNRYAKESHSKKLIIIPEKVNNEGVYIEWVQYEDEKNLHNKPIFVILPGITGTFDDSYVYNLSIYGKKNNYDVVIYKMRTLSSEMKMPPDDKPISFVDDFEEALNLIISKNKNKIYAIGGSYGANTLYTYLGTLNCKNKKIEAGITISNPFDLFIAERVGDDTLLESLILYFEKKNYLNACINANKYKNGFFNIEILKNSVKLIDFDNNFFKKIRYSKNLEDYYRTISSHDKTSYINVPLLAINSRDDHITTFLSVPIDSIKQNPNIIFIATDKGSHLSFIENKGILKFHMWFIDVAFQYFNYLSGNL